jgi:Methyltransferase domain
MRGFLARLAASRGVESREAKWELYRHAFPPREGERILDVGASQTDDLPGENYFLRRYPHPDQVTAVGVQDMEPLRERYPAVNFVQADGRELPFADEEFDVVHSNAVIEHVGPQEDQERFVAELVRVSKAGFVTTPNRWFPIEAHTHLPVFHWLPRPLATAVMRRDWFVWLLSRRSFAQLFPRDVDFEMHVQRMGGWPATLIAIFRRRDGSKLTPPDRFA